MNETTHHGDPGPAGERTRGSGEARGLHRRDFLAMAGFTFGGALLSGCRPARVEKAIPFLVAPEEVSPGISEWYATTCGGCAAGCGVMVKNRDGRPIKLEGIPGHPVSGGGLCPAGQAQLLGLYDSHRLAGPIKEATESTWEEADREIMQSLREIDAGGGAVRLLTGTISSPTTTELIRAFLAGFRNAKHIQYDPLSCSAILDAHERTHGVRVLPRYRFDLAEIIVSFDADFLGTWISPVEFTAAYRAGRNLEAGPAACSLHIQFESRVSLTGSNADRRIMLSPRGLRESVRRLESAIAGMSGLLSVPPAASGGADGLIADLAARLWRARGRCLVVSGINDPATQVLVNSINHMLGNYGGPLDIGSPSLQRRGSDAALQELAEDLDAGRVSALIMQGVNPVYDAPGGLRFAGALKSVPLTVAVSERLDETASEVRFVCPEPHWLESWNDAEPVAGTYSLAQPVISPFGNTRSFSESLSAWMGRKKAAVDLIRREWEKTVFSRMPKGTAFGSFWDESLRRGWVRTPPAPAGKTEFAAGSVPRDAVQPRGTGGTEFALVLYPTVAIGDGRHAHNPWLQELPDPVTKLVWDNAASFSPPAAAALGIEEGDEVRIDAGDVQIELPAHIQPGQHDAVIAVPLGYGRKGTERFANIGPRWFEAGPTVPPGGRVGSNAAPFLIFGGGAAAYDARNVFISKTGRRRPLACTQQHHSLHVPAALDPGSGERRPIVQETTFAAFLKDPASGSFGKHEEATMWPEDHPYTGHHWGMAVDLSACTGCSACVVGCQAENNIPLVGKDEVSRNRSMQWIRIDRYYDRTPGGGVNVQHQPMMCQHCGNAPCETVCPVLATVHSGEGLNQQVYNRCVGTRYCSNNCPYKVRRFNWFEVDHGDDMQRLVLNPDITVRERGVMEKCSMCVQRIQEGKIAAKNSGRPVRDGEILPACAQSCPAQAIVFGDMNDPGSRLVRLMNNPRYYRVLEELGVKPSVGYLTLVRNREEGEAEGV